MTALSKRAGRPRKPAIKRQPNGRPSTSRLSQREAATSTVKRQRMARGATAENYQDQRHESPLGRLYLSGAIGKGETAQDRYESGQWFASLYKSFRGAIGARKPYASLPEPGVSGTEDEAATARTVERYNHAIRKVPVLSRGALMDVVVCQNDASPGMVTALVDALDALTHHRLTPARE